jgi:23S rRNA pseudouridine1911/1915/1917 synthase
VEQLLEFIVADDCEVKTRLDKYIAAQSNLMSRAKIQTLIKSSAVTVNGMIVTDISAPVKPGQVITMHVESNSESTITPKKMDFTIVYEDEYLLVIDKPAGLTVHPGAGNHNDTLVNGLMYHCGEQLSSIGGEARPGIVHRLDRDTSGLMVVAKDDFTHAALSEALALREIRRTYHAYVYGCPRVPVGKVETYIDRCPSNRLKMRANTSGRGKLAVTHYKLLETFYEKKFSLVECRLETGRTHQIRVHMEYRKYPVIGDPLYGKERNYNLEGVEDEIKAKIQGLQRQALHAVKLEFEHPHKETWMTFESSMPQEIDLSLYQISD